MNNEPVAPELTDKQLATAIRTSVKDLNVLLHDARNRNMTVDIKSIVTEPLIAGAIYKKFEIHSIKQDL